MRALESGAGLDLAAAPRHVLSGGHGQRRASASCCGASAWADGAAPCCSSRSPMGTRLSALALDVLGGPDQRRAARLLTGVGACGGALSRSPGGPSTPGSNSATGA
ncbi:hypothetical protein QJS66_01345 [Kocuria rhizophila]|nr:hypothetical protein QJS66_01345 [Kocuria rhizophila]